MDPMELLISERPALICDPATVRYLNHRRAAFFGPNEAASAGSQPTVKSRGRRWVNERRVAKNVGMSTSQDQLAAPPIDALLGETVATLLYAAMAYLEPRETDAAPDLASAEMAVDVAGIAFNRIALRLRPDAHRALTVMLTEARLAIVRKRG
jgi:hypothetical protein